MRLFSGTFMVVLSAFALGPSALDGHDDGYTTSTYSLTGSSGENAEHHLNGLLDCNSGSCIPPWGELIVQDSHAWGPYHTATSPGVGGGGRWLQAVKNNISTYCPEGETRNASGATFDSDAPGHFHPSLGTVYLDCDSGGLV